jgi:hypothetical protein
MTFLVIVPFSLLPYALDLDEWESALKNLMEKNPVFFAVFGVFLAPIIEEPVFRLHLNLKVSSILWSLGLSIFLINEFWYPLLLLWVYLGWLLIRVKQGNPPSVKAPVFFSSFVFALIHLANYPSLNYSTQFYLIPLLIGAQFFIGIVNSSIRLRFGMRWAIIFHGAYNGVLIGLCFLFFDLG